MENNCTLAENGSGESVFTSAKLNTSCSIRRSLLGGEDSPLPHAKLGSSPLPAVASDRFLGRNTSGTVLDSGICGCKSCTGTVMLSLVCLMLVSVSVFNNWNVQSVDCPFVATLGDPNRETGASELRNLINSQDEETSGSEMNQNADHSGKEYIDDFCWSRSRHLLYRPEDRRLPPSPALRRSLLQYEGLHARCTVGNSWKGVADLQDMSAQGECKYLIYVEGWEGLGNRLLSLVSAFAFSLATDRILLIDSRGHLSDLLCEPFSSSSWKLPKDFPYDQVRSFPSLENVDKYENELGINVNLRHEQSERDQTFFCPETQERLSSVQWLAWNSNQYFIPRLFMTPLFWTRLHPLFPRPQLAFSQLVRYLCLPVNSVWAKTERIYQAYLLSTPKLVGLQIRAPSLHSFSRGVNDKVMNCVVGAEILPNVSRHNSARPALTLQRKSRTGPGGASIVFVASLHREYYETLRDFYMDRSTADGSVVSVHTVAYEGAEIHSYEATVKAYIDIWLLSFSDVLVTTGWSTFGYIAQGLCGVPPYIMDLKATSPPFCSVGQSVEPCNHYSFLSTCGTTSDLSSRHASWVDEHIRRCQDEYHGLQIV